MNADVIDFEQSEKVYSATDCKHYITSVFRTAPLRIQGLNLNVGVKVPRNGTFQVVGYRPERLGVIDSNIKIEIMSGSNTSQNAGLAGMQGTETLV